MAVSVTQTVGASIMQLNVRGAVLHLTVDEAEKVVSFLSHALRTTPDQVQVDRTRNRLQTTYVAGR